MEKISFIDGLSLLSQISTIHKDLDSFLFKNAKVQKGGFPELFASMSKTNQKKYIDMLMHGSFTKDPKNILSMIKK